MGVFHSGTEPVTVLVFISDDCPIANRYVPELKRLQHQFGPRGVAFWLVHSDPSESAAEIRGHAREYQLDFHEIRDPHHELARLAKAEVTPSAAVFYPGQTLVYRGRIDDRFVELGRERPRATQHDLAEALEAVLLHKPVAVPVTKAVGCYIPASQ